MSVSSIRAEGARLAVVVPTYRRPDSLVLTLDSLFAQGIGEPFRIVVADNDAATADGLAAATAWAEARGVTAAMTLIRVAERGISHNRNAGLRAAFGIGPHVEAVAMIDDDAVADPGWLGAIDAARKQFGADVVCGPQVFAFAAETPDWVRTANPFQTFDRPTGVVIDNRSMCNAMLSRRLVDTLGEVFDPAFGLSGGEDIDMFERSRAAGLRMAWCAEAIVREPVPAERATRAWLLRRAWSAGHILARIAIKYQGPRATPAQFALAVRTILSGLARQALGPSVGDRFDGASRVRVGLGRIAGLLQPPSIQY